MVRRTLLVGAVAVAVVVAIIASGTPNPEDTASPAPELPTQVLLPPRVRLAALRGEPAAINFWASWCGPCHQEAPELARLPAELEGRARLVGVNWSDNAGDARSFVNHYHWHFPVLRDDNGTVGTRYGLSGLPTTFILDRRGRIIRELRGPQTAAVIERELAGIPR